jgi:nicotinamide-nucleotide amidase
MSGTCIDAKLIEAASAAAKILRARRFTVVTAESCTAGLIAAALSQVEDASEVLHGSFVVYTKENKAKALGVDRKILSENSAVCAEVAEQLACGALERSPADISLAVTGVLGPDPDEDGNPVGLVYFAVCSRGAKPIVTKKNYEKDDPDRLRHKVTLDGLERLSGVVR